MPSPADHSLPSKEHQNRSRQGNIKRTSETFQNQACLKLVSFHKTSTQKPVKTTFIWYLTFLTNYVNNRQNRTKYRRYITNHNDRTCFHGRHWRLEQGSSQSALHSPPVASQHLQTIPNVPRNFECPSREVEERISTDSLVGRDWIEDEESGLASAVLVKTTELTNKSTNKNKEDFRVAMYKSLLMLQTDSDICT